MDALTLAAFEERAAAAEARLSVLESKLTGTAGGVPATLVSDLEGLKELLQKAKEEREQLAQEKDEAVKAKQALEVENGKLQYRIKHLVRAVREGDEELAKLQAA